MKRFVKIFAVFLVMISCVNMTAFANSGPSEWYGTDSAGVIMREDCPLVVEKEVLTFDIAHGAQDYYTDYNAEEFKNYTDKFTAEYTFYNPTDTEITAKLAFPLGIMPQYVDLERNTESNCVTVNGAEIEKEIRYTKSEDFYSFDFNKEIPKLVDGYMEDDFYSPDMTVTKYTIIPKVDAETDYHREMVLVWDGALNQGTKIIPLGFSSYSWQEGQKAEIGGSILDNELVIYAIGQPIDVFEYNFYDSGRDDAKQLDGDIEIIQEETTLENLLVELCTGINEKWNVSPVDTYNMFVSSTFSQDYYSDIGIIHTDDIYFHSANLICWYLYDITVGPGEVVTNTVTAPVYPDVNMRYTPRKYGYTYLLSPAGKWAQFGDIEINVNTPFYMLESSVEGFEKTESGYVYKGTGLPQGELEFIMCESENPQKEKANNAYILLLFAPLVLAVVLCAGFVMIIIKLAGRKKR